MVDYTNAELLMQEGQQQQRRTPGFAGRVSDTSHRLKAIKVALPPAVQPTAHPLSGARDGHRFSVSDSGRVSCGGWVISTVSMRRGTYRHLCQLFALLDSRVAASAKHRATPTSLQLSAAQVPASHLCHLVLLCAHGATQVLHGPGGRGVDGTQTARRDAD